MIFKLHFDLNKCTQPRSAALPVLAASLGPNTYSDAWNSEMPVFRRHDRKKKKRSEKGRKLKAWNKRLVSGSVTDRWFALSLVLLHLLHVWPLTKLSPYELLIASIFTTVEWIDLKYPFYVVLNKHFATSDLLIVSEVLRSTFPPLKNHDITLKKKFPGL